MLKKILFIDNRESQCTKKKKDDADMSIESLNSFLYQSGLTGMSEYSYGTKRSEIDGFSIVA